MKVVVTGASGFLGAHVVQRLSAIGWEVVAVSRSGTVPARCAWPSTVRTLAVDLASDDSVALLERELGGDVALVHLAARRAQGADASAERRELMSVNVLGTLRAYEAARGRARVIVYASSHEVYGVSLLDRPLTEQDPVAPESDHAVTKLTGEDHLLAFSEEQKQRVVALRFSSLYGRGARDGHGVSGYLHAVARGELPRWYGSERETLDALHVADAALAVELALSREVSGVFNVSDGALHSARSVAALALGMAELPGDPEQLPSSAERTHSGLDTTRARSLLGFVPEVTLERGMREQLLGLQSQGKA